MRASRFLTLFTLSGAMALFSAAACSSDADDDDDAVGGAGGGTTSTGTGTGTGTSTGTTPSGQGSDGNDSCAEAVPLGDKSGYLGVWGSGVLNPPGDADYFTFTASAGDWVGLFTVANEDDDTDMVDTVITLHNADGTSTIAENDDAYPRLSTDSEMWWHVTDDGTYCLKVWEWADWAGEDPEGDPSFMYEVAVLPLDFASMDGYTEDTESNDVFGDAQAASVSEVGTNGQNYSAIAGLLDPGTDVDFYSITPPATALSLSVYFTPDGVTGFGSTQGPGNISLIATDGTTVIGELDNQQGADGLSIPIDHLTDTDFFLKVERPNETLGANDFYFVKYFTSHIDNERETGWPTEAAANDITANANAATQTPDAAPSDFDQAFVMGTVDDTDVDFWSFTVADGDSVLLSCGALRSGSGVTDLNVQIMDSSGAVKQQETEVADDDISWSINYPEYGSMASLDVAVGEGGTWYLRLSAGGQNPAITSNFYRCGIRSGVPATP